MHNHYNMNHEFISVRGKVVLNDKRLLIQDLKVNFAKTLMAEILLPLILLTIVVISTANPEKPFGYFAAVIYALIFFFYYFKQLFIALFKKSYASHIPVNRIESFEIKADEFGLETEVILHLKNKRFRSIPFRTREKEYEAFLEQLSQYIAQLQFA